MKEYIKDFVTSFILMVLGGLIFLILAVPVMYEVTASRKMPYALPGMPQFYKEKKVIILKK